MMEEDSDAPVDVKEISGTHQLTQMVDVYWQMCQRESEPEAIRTDVSWKELDFDAARAEAAKRSLSEEVHVVPADVRENLEMGYSEKWEQFYSKMKNKFFKERHYLHYVFEDLKYTPSGASKLDGKRLLEIGCGTGSTLFPLLDAHRGAFFYTVDLSPHAIDVLKTHDAYDATRCRALACDAVRDPLPAEIVPGSIDYVLLIFVLSAVAPHEMDVVLRKAFEVLKPGGRVLFRDYGIYDMTQLRFRNKQGRKLGENYYIRADGTSVYFFTVEELTTMFTKAGFTTVNLRYDTRELRNRKRMINMYRVWTNGVFEKPADPQASLSQEVSRTE